MYDGKNIDHLTGLCSREAFYLQVRQILNENPDTQYDMVVADVENFKVVNERFGVKNGDRVLRHMADRYLSLLNGEGICTRLHADVFAILIEHGDGGWEDRILWQFGEEVEESELQNLVIKYGIYENVEREVTAFGMCDRAVLALNRIKRLYGKNVAKYNDSLRSTLLREQQILDSMETALEEHQFRVYYQPKYDIHAENIIGAEALVRWMHPEMGFMSPGEFIPLFEKNGFIEKLDYYVWEEVCKVLRKWKEEGKKMIPVSVNVSRVDFNATDLVERIVDLADRYDIDKSFLHLEITESVYTEEPQRIIQMVSRLHESGFKIEMDDFGSGYSSLNMLSELSVDILKLDMKFIQKNSSNQKSILGFIISLSKWMNLATVAEGVETKEQIDKLRSFGCDYVQGYYYAKPVPYAEFEQLLNDDSEKTIRENLLGETVPVSENIETEKYTLLIVDDNEINRELLKFMLEPIYDLREVCNGQEACDYIREHPGEIQLILLDLVMPVMDGFQFMEKRKQTKELAEIPVIITSESEEDSELIALRLGAERFVGKPYRKELLLLSIKKVVENFDK